ncbi:putative serine/threonine exchanger SteT [Gemella bergeri ATCC 700627]|uniref:Putative serine/threonine exchanger SteT n=1 Tax=Gemella bergeri ATCC 700627 TaxID=1321820 RepID=U2QMF1_9BACL|nr:amino acid permease [Gemella bergeri]ERK57696.1 putative serine/threonine exchanger SteT [Gemella bergeri ATCC 700627]
MNDLKKDIGFFGAFSTVVGVVIGSGVFFKAAVIYKTTGNVSLGLLAWILAGIISICAGLTTAELAAAIPETGGMIVWVERAYGKTMSYLLGWAQAVIYYPASIAAASAIFATQFTNLFHIDKKYSILVGACGAATVTCLNLLGSKASGRIQTVATICKLIPIITIIVFGLLQPNPTTVEFLPTGSGNSSLGGASLSAVGAALLAAMYGYDGWINVGTVAGEMKDPKRDLPRAILYGLLVITAIYLLINVAYLMTMPMEQIAGNGNVPNDVATKLFGSYGGKIITIGIMISVYGTMNGFTMTAIRVPYAMAMKDQIPFKNIWIKLNSFSIPYVSALVTLVLTIAMMFTGEFDTLTDFLLFTIWIFFILTFFAVFVLRKKEPELPRPYKVPLYPIIPIIAIVGGAYIVIAAIITQFTLAVSGVALTLAGLIFYTETHKKFKK